MSTQDWWIRSLTVMHGEESVISSSLELSFQKMSGEAALIIEEVFHLCWKDVHKKTSSGQLLSTVLHWNLGS